MQKIEDQKATVTHKKAESKFAVSIETRRN
jgi:hypothetical protein